MARKTREDLNETEVADYARQFAHGLSDKFKGVGFVLCFTVGRGTKATARSYTNMPNDEAMTLAQYTIGDDADATAAEFAIGNPGGHLH